MSVEQIWEQEPEWIGQFVSELESYPRIAPIRIFRSSERGAVISVYGGKTAVAIADRDLLLLEEEGKLACFDSDLSRVCVGCGRDKLELVTPYFLSKEQTSLVQNTRVAKIFYPNFQQTKPDLDTPGMFYRVCGECWEDLREFNEKPIKKK